MSNEINTCSICLCDDINLIHPKECTCKIYLHNTCLILCKNYGLACPICRLKTYSHFQYDDGIRNIEVDEFDEEPVNPNQIIRCPYNPRLFSGIIGGMCLGFLTYLIYSGNGN